MSMDKIQLKQEDIVNDNVVLTDINPITNTPSIVDASNGETMDATMLRVWEAINNKISRVVNSVNGRTGVVVLTSDDVGLGNVDNVSFSDIKSWVIEQIQNAFKNKKMRFYDTFADAENAMRSNDKMLAWAPFYCERYDDFDKRCVIGVFGWNPETSTLNIDAYRKLNTIGEADETIIYRMSSSDYPQEPLPDDRRIPVGGIGVNIYQEPNPDDQILFVEGVGRNDKSLSGLRVHNEKLGFHMYYESSPYGPQVGQYAYNRDVEHGMLWTTAMTDSNKDPRCVKICVNGSEITPEYTTTTTSTDPSILAPDGYFHFNKNWAYVNRLKVNDLILMQFDDLVEPVNDGGTRNRTSVGICLELSGRQMALGIVSQEEIDSETVIVINFHTLRRTLNGYGIRELESHVDGTVHDVQLGLDAFQTTRIQSKDISFPVNMSGINAHADRGTRGSATDAYKAHVTSIHTPWGINIDANSGMHIETDASMCIYPEYQSLPTQYTPRKVIPQFVPGKYYEREANDYVVLSSEPIKWEYEYHNYYYYDETSQTYKPVPGIDLLYSPLNPESQTGSSEYQYCTGSIFGRNASYRETSPRGGGGGQSPNILNNYTPSDENAILSPKGSDPKDGLLGTHSCLSLNFRKLSSSWTYHNMDLYTADIGACKTLYDISGLRLTPITSSEGSISHVGNLMTHNFDQETLFDIGIYDNKDANGNDVSEILFGGITNGISVNVGKFLEIAPKEVFRAEKYTESGKVQVRVGQGLTDETEWIDLTDLIKANNPGSAEWRNRTGLKYVEVCRRWMTHPEEFYITNTDDPTDPEIHLERNRFRYQQVDSVPPWEYVVGNVYEKNQNDTYTPVAEKPDDWDLTYGYYYHDPAGTGGEYIPMPAQTPSDYEDEWYKYYMFNIGTPDTPDYVFLPYRNGEAPSLRPVDESYMGPYYTYKRSPFDQWTDGNKIKHGTFAELKRYFETLDPGSAENSYHIFWKKPHNRITVDIDPETLAFNEKNQLTVIGGTGSGEESKGANIRIIDNRGVFFDTVPNKPIDEIIKLGNGLKVSGSSVSIPADMKLTYDSYHALLQDILANMSCIEIAYYAVADASKVDQGNPYSFTLDSIPGWEITFDHIIQQLPGQYAGGTYTCAMCEQGFANTGDKLNQLLGDTETTVEYGDVSYNIPTATYQTGEIRLYLTGKYIELKNRITAIYKGINDTVTDADSVSKVKQYIADHYGLDGSAITDDMMIKQIIYNVELYNATIIDESKKYGFDWLFSYFVQQILIGGYWENIAAGQFNYTELTARPYDWNSSFRRSEGGSRKYFQKSNDDPNIYVNVPIGNMPYYPGLYYTTNNPPATRTLIISDTEPSEFNSCFYKNRFTLTTQEPADWETNYSKYFVYDSDGDFVANVYATTAPTWEANKYYVEDHSGLFESYQQVTDVPAFFASELGTADNKIPIAPVWAEHTFFTESSGTYTEQTERPNDWFTNYTSYYRREGTEGEYTYYAVAARMVKIRDHTDHYYSRELIPPSSNP